ncbi:MAG: hypothetical protein J2P26_08450 [Nocardiopsaceae bacterium]|nr:hypothetical protein [Nocardiopsaceae bacterium]
MNRNNYRPWVATALLGGALAVSGCGGSSHPDHPHAPSSTQVPSSTQAPSSHQPTPPASTSAALPSAADGTDAGACADANCEVRLSHAVTLTMHCGECGIATLRMSVSSDGVDFDGTATDGTLVGADDQLPNQGGPSTFNQVSMAVVAFNGKEAVIKLSS